MTSDPAPLDPAVKVDLWRQRFFEAQAAAEEFILGVHGDEGVSAWIQANSRITADLLRSQRPAGESATVHFMTRLQRQLLLYDSAVTSEPQPSGTVLRNAECGILRYRKQAASAGVKLTFASPCPYCQELNTAIAARYVESDVTVSCEQAGDGCTWRAESRHASGDGATGSPDRGGTVD
ncbi:hypothetical protein [Micromonospora sp. NPDC047074]|uniref:hypothetical protein n=1 Tax=Micromonospora sp. NPDC047074 TaxID=3154339 RepID=UPI0033D92C94